MTLIGGRDYRIAAHDLRLLWCILKLKLARDHTDTNILPEILIIKIKKKMLVDQIPQ